MDIDTTTFVLCRLSQREADHIGMAASVAGGWVAASDDVAVAMEHVIGAGCGILALLPSDWREARRPVGADVAAQIADRLSARSPAWSERIRSATSE